MDNQVQVTKIKRDYESCESKWGYHPCNYTTFLRLKKLYKAFWVHVTKAAAFNRFIAKRAENRRGNVPVFCKKLVEKKRLQTWHSCEIYKLFQAARMPSPQPVEKFGRLTLETIHEMESYLDSWEKNQGVTKDISPVSCDISSLTQSSSDNKEAV